MKKYLRWWINGSILCVIISMFNSCASTRNIPYFEDIPDTAKLSIRNQTQYSDPVIMPDDILSVTVITIDPTTSAPVNQAASVAVSPSSSSSSSSASPATPGLLVDKNGNISLPIIGTVKVAGLTTFEAKALIKKRAEQFFKEPDVQLRFANFKISVLGEVAHPSVYVLPNEKVSILDALSLAGDLTIYGRRENILVIRDIDGKKTMARLDLNNTDIFNSPYFYLRQNDVVYVEPNASAIVQADEKQTRIITIAAALVTSIVILLIRLDK